MSGLVLSTLEMLTYLGGTRLAQLVKNAIRDLWVLSSSMLGPEIT